MHHVGEVARRRRDALPDDSGSWRRRSPTVRVRGAVEFAAEVAASAVRECDRSAGQPGLGSGLRHASSRKWLRVAAMGQDSGERSHDEDPKAGAAAGSVLARARLHSSGPLGCRGSGRGARRESHAGSCLRDHAQQGRQGAQTADAGWPSICRLDGERCVHVRSDVHMVAG